MNMKQKIIGLLVLLTGGVVFANVEPTVQVKSVAMRPGTTLMDVVYRIDDPDDATVKIRALAFVDGLRSFANVLKPVTWAEGTEISIGDAIATGVDHTLTWNIGADWDIDLGQVMFEVLCRDSRGLLRFDWITIPAAGGYDEVTISKNSPNYFQVLDALYWLYATGDSTLTLSNGVLRGNASAEAFSGEILCTGNSLMGDMLGEYAPAYICKKMNLQPADQSGVYYANNMARAELSDTARLHAFNSPYIGIGCITTWGSGHGGDNLFETGYNVTAIAAGRSHSVALKSDGTVAAWGSNTYGQCDVPADLTNVTAIEAVNFCNMALKSDRTVAAWGYNTHGQSDVPSDLTNVTAIAIGYYHSMALKGDATVTVWGDNSKGQCNVPSGLTNVTAIAAGIEHCVALKSDASVVAWGYNYFDQCDVPADLTNVIAVAAGGFYSMAIKRDGSVVAWGDNRWGQCNVPAGLTNVMALGPTHCMALKHDGSVVAWGNSSDGQCDVPVGLSSVTAIATGTHYSMALKAKQP